MSNLGNSTNDRIITYTSPSINFKTVGNTTIFTTQFGLKFVPISASFICDAASAANGNASINIGTNAAAFDNWVSGATSTVTAANTVCTFVQTSSGIVFPASTAITCRIAIADTGTSITGRVSITGFYDQ